VAEVKAYLTTTPGRYFTPNWNRKWYCVEYDPSAPMTAWMPMTFIGTCQKDGKTYTRYAAEIDYYAGGTASPELATLEIYVDDKNVVTDHSVRTYKVDKDGKVHNDRSSYKMKAGDKMQFYAYGFHKTDPEQDGWFEADEMITFTQSPKFTVELLEFEDDKGVLLPYKYSMWGEDINGNGVMTPLTDVAVPDTAVVSGKATVSVAGYADLAVANATVSLEGTDYTAKTDSSGYFSIAGVTPGTYTAVITAPDIAPVRKEITLQKGDSFTLDPAMKVSKGDINNDGKIGLEDIVYGLQVISGMGTQ
jgi:hypothetical protein